MTSYSISDMVMEVKVLLDRNRTNSALVSAGDVETLQQDALIEPRILEAVQLIELHAPTSMLTDAQVVTATNASAYTFTEPILRLVGVRGSGWGRAPRMITSEDEEYSYQHSPYGVKGNNERPYCAVIDNGGYVKLEFFPSTTANITYLPIPSVSNGYVSICKACKHAVVYAAASLVSGAMGDANGASTLLGMAYQMAGIQTGQTDK